MYINKTKETDCNMILFCLFFLRDFQIDLSQQCTQGIAVMIVYQIVKVCLGVKESIHLGMGNGKYILQAHLTVWLLRLQDKDFKVI